MLQSKDAAGLVTDYEYDEKGQLTLETERNPLPGGTVTEIRSTAYAYDAAGREVERKLPDGSKERQVYDTLGNHLIVIDAEGNAARMIYDEGGPMSELIQYKKGTNTLEQRNESAHSYYVANGNGDIVLARDPNGNLIRYVYDGGHQVLTETHSGPDMQGDSITLTYAYDPQGHIVTETDGNGHVTRYAYDAKGQLVRKTDAAGQWTASEYSPAGYQLAERRPLGRDTGWTIITRA